MPNWFYYFLINPPLLPLLLMLSFYLYKVEKKRKEDVALTKAIFELLGVEIELKNNPKDLIDANKEFGDFGYRVIGKKKGYFLVKGYNRRGYFESYVVVENDAVVKLTTQSESPQGEVPNNE